jgi:hypothetical protein
MKVRILNPAIEDLVVGRRFYEQQREGIGTYFFDSLFTEIDSLILYGGIHSLHCGYNRLLASRFPYAVYYKVIEGEIVVFRVLDCRRDPREIRTALRQT